MKWKYKQNSRIRSVLLPCTLISWLRRMCFLQRGRSREGEVWVETLTQSTWDSEPSVSWPTCLWFPFRSPETGCQSVRNENTHTHTHTYDPHTSRWWEGCSHSFHWTVTSTSIPSSFLQNKRSAYFLFFSPTLFLTGVLDDRLFLRAAYNKRVHVEQALLFKVTFPEDVTVDGHIGCCC